MSALDGVDFSSLDRVSGHSCCAGLFQLTSTYYEAGTVIYAEGSKFDGVYFVEHGIAKMEMLLEGETALTSLALCGDVMGIDSFHGKTYASSAVCVADLSVVWVPAECFYFLVRTNGSFRLRIEEAIGKAILESTTMIKLLSRDEADAKVAYLLLKIFLGRRRELQNKNAFNVGLSRAEMADYLGLRMETVSRKLATLRNLGIIRVKGRRIYVRDCEGLRQLCSSVSKMMYQPY